MSYSIYYSYDSSGRLDRRYTDGAAPTADARYFTYNQRNMVTRIDHRLGSGTPDVNRYFTYNGLGERVSGYDGSAQHEWQYDRGELVRDKIGAGTARYNHDGARASLAGLEPAADAPRAYTSTGNAGAGVEPSLGLPTVATTTGTPGGGQAGFGLGTRLGVGRFGSVNTVLLEGIDDAYISQDFGAFGDTLYSLDLIGGSPKNKAKFGVDLGLVALETSLTMYVGPVGSLYFPSTATLAFAGLGISSRVLLLPSWVGPWEGPFDEDPRGLQPMFAAGRRSCTPERIELDWEEGQDLPTPVGKPWPQAYSGRFVALKAGENPLLYVFGVRVKLDAATTAPERCVYQQWVIRYAKQHTRDGKVIETQIGKHPLATAESKPQRPLADRIENARRGYMDGPWEIDADMTQGYPVPEYRERLRAVKDRKLEMMWVDTPGIDPARRGDIYDAYFKAKVIASDGVLFKERFWHLRMEYTGRPGKMATYEFTPDKKP